MLKTKTKILKKKKPTVKCGKKSIVAKKTEEPKIKKEKYFEGVGRRKTAIARVRLFAYAPLSRKNGAGFPQILINGKPLEEYFATIELQQAVYAPLNLMNFLEQLKVSVKVKGGGIVSQAEAVRHGVARALVLFNPDFRKKLKKAGYLKRDPRMRERKKFGLKRARRAPQWSKR